MVVAVKSSDFESGQVWRQYIFGFIGPFLGSYIAATLGRKTSLIAISIPFFVGLTLIALAKTIMHIYVGRVIWGISVGCTFTVLPMYLVEIATLKARGILSTFLELFVGVGICSAYVIGPYVSYQNFAYIGLAITGTCISFYILPESPRFYLMKYKSEDAAASLMALRGKSRKGVDEELAELTDEVNTLMDKKANFMDLFKGSNLKCLVISLFLMFFQQFSGITPVLFFTTNIFEAAGAKLDKFVATIIVGVVQMGSSLTSSILVERLGRKVLLLISTAGLTIGMGFLGLYFYLEEIKHPMVPKLGLLPVTSLAVYMIGYYMGLGPISYTLINEMMSIETKAVASPCIVAFNWCMAFVSTRYFVPAAVALGWYFVFWILAGICICAFLFTLLVVPETKGLTALQIQDLLAGKKSTPEKEEYEEGNGIYRIKV